MTQQDEKIAKEVARWFIELSGIFGHFAFFTNELWRNVEGFKYEDEAEIIAAFLTLWVHEKFGFNGSPCGASWCYFFEDKSFYEAYIEKYRPVFKAYADWQISQI